MLLWRICRRRYAASAWTGAGARLFGGRWNSPGTSVVYTSTSLALAAVETFVHLEPNLQPDDLVSIAVECPDGLPVSRIEPAALPSDWARRRDDSLREFGDGWLRAAKTVALHVPSAAIHGEWNVLLNPAHPDFRRIRSQPPRPFEFDLRMFR
jgi:RES domain-containing protein